MCFSATVSLGAGVVLSGIGVASIRKAQSPSQILFAGIPLIFAAQQITEGMLWLIISNPAYESLQQITTIAFIFFAQVLWPAWVPFSILKLESEEKRKPMLRILVGIGALVSLYLLYAFCNYDVEAKIVSQHIVYSFDYPNFLMSLCGLLYIVVTIMPPFLSSRKYMKMLGTGIFISYIITTIFYADYLISVWCFFASIISIAIYVIIYEINHPGKTDLVPKLETGI